MSVTRIFIDATSTFLYGGNSGIQRVTRNIANHSRAVGSQLSCPVNPFIWTGFGFIVLTEELVDQPPLILRLLPHRIRRSSRARRSLGLFIVAPLRLAVMLVSIFGWRPSRDWLERLYLLIVCFFSFPRQLVLSRFVSFRKGDVVLLVDSTWNFLSMFDALSAAQRHSLIRVAPMIHDLFPLSIPHTCEEDTVTAYTRWFYRVIPHADFAVVNSMATKKSLEAFLASSPGLRKYPLEAVPFRLGAELDLIRPSRHPAQVPEELPALPGVVLLSIGTIEPRKNIPFILDAYDHLRRSGLDVSLVIIGRVGWKSDDTIRRIRTHSDLGTRLLYYSNASDSLLSAALERADGMVIASMAEGFGLPVVEGLMHGLHVFASDIDVFREIADGHCQFFALEDSRNLADAIRQWIDARQISGDSTSHQPFAWVGWEQSTKELMDSVLQFVGSGAFPDKDPH